MLIKNQGFVETIVNEKNEMVVNKTKWDAKYDGEHVNILLDSNTNGNSEVYSIELDNNDLANLLKIPSVDLAIHKRLSKDFPTKSKTTERRRKSSKKKKTHKKTKKKSTRVKHKL